MHLVGGGWGLVTVGFFNRSIVGSPAGSSSCQCRQGNVSLGTNYSVQTYEYTGWDDAVQTALTAYRLDEHTLRFEIPPVGVCIALGAPHAALRSQRGGVSHASP